MAGGSPLALSDYDCRLCQPQQPWLGKPSHESQGSTRKCMHCISGQTSGKSDVLTAIVEQMAMPNTSYAWHCHNSQHRRQR